MSKRFLSKNGKAFGVSFTREEIDVAVKYWTKERMEAAKPDVMVVSEQQSSTENDQGEYKADTLEVKIADTTVAPFSAGGKLFFTTPDGDKIASAEFCGDNQIILSAAHCFYDFASATEVKNMVFYRCYDDGDAEQIVPVISFVIPNEYKNKKNSSYDYGFGVTEVAAAQVEPLTYEINSISGSAIAYGYPTDYECGKKMVYVEGQYTKYRSGILETLGNPMCGGCSGGAWVNKDTGHVVSVNSFHYVSAPNNEYGPLFTEEFETLFNAAKEQVIDPNRIRYYTLHNDAAVVARMRVYWSLDCKTGSYEEDGYHDICAAAERTLDMAGKGIPDGATVRLKAVVPMGDDDEADETFIFHTQAAKTAVYKLTGSAFKTHLTLKYF